MTKKSYNPCKCSLIDSCSIMAYHQAQVDNCPCQECLVKPICKERCRERKRYFVNVRADKWTNINTQNNAKDVG